MKRKKHSPKRYWLIGGGVVAVVAIIITARMMAPVNFTPDAVVKMSAAQEAARRTRILAIYDSLKLPASYKQVDENIFGQKRLYSWDHGRSFASSRSYIRDATPAATLADVQPLIEAAGFKFNDEPYPNEIDKEMHYKSAAGEYVRLRISSKPRDDALRAAGPKGNIDNAPNGTGGPANVVIEVNLDDNND